MAKTSAKTSAPVEQHLLERLVHAQAPEVEGLLFDPVTSLPNLTLLLPEVRRILGERRSLGLLTVNVAQLSKVEEVYGWQTFDQIVRGVAACLKEVKKRAFRSDDLLAELTVNGNVFVLLLSPPRTKTALSAEDLAGLKRRVTGKLEAFLRKALPPELRQQFDYFVGGAILKPNPLVRAERLLYRAVEELLAQTMTAQERALRLKGRDLRTIVKQRRISTVFQPILDLQRRRVIGYEALSRGPRGPYHRPELLFRVAYETEQIRSLDRLCRARAARGLPRLAADQLLFLNVEPMSVFDPALASEGPLARRHAQVVFEITEREAIADFATFRQSCQLLRSSGFKLAVDDVGAAYAGLRLITEVAPDFIKIDMALTRDAHHSQVKRQLIRAVASFCAESQLPLIAEGVETPEELGTVAALGVHLVQGHLFGQPAARPGAEHLTFPELPPAS